MKEFQNIFDAKLISKSVPWLEVSIDGFRIWLLVGKIKKKKSETSIWTENWRVHAPIAQNWWVQLHPSHPH